MGQDPKRIKNSEIREYLLRYALDKGILVTEHVSDWRDGSVMFYCHLQREKEPEKTATSVSYEGPDNALVMAFLSYSNPEMDFI
jgi:hypothetical protein